jgi:predicted permease
MYRLVWRLAPPQTRRAYRAEMSATFDAACRDAAGRGWLALCVLLVRETTDMVKTRMPSTPALMHTPRTMPRGVVRSLIRRPAYAAAVILTLAFGTGVTTTLFSIVDSVLLQPLPYPDSDQLVTVFEASPETPGRGGLAAPGRLEDWRTRSDSFVAIAGSYGENVTDTSPRDPERLSAVRVTPHYFDVYGAMPLAGRTFSSDEEQPTGPMAAVISEPFWTRRFGRSPDAVGHVLNIGGQTTTIVGVLPGTFTAASVDVWLPAKIQPGLMAARAARFMSGVGRMKAGVTIEQARADLERVQGLLGEQFPETDRGWTPVLGRLKDARVAGQRDSLWTAFGAVIAVWLIAIANVGSLSMVHIHRRARELVIRGALGGTRGHIVVMVSLEMLILAVLGCAGGLLLATFLVSLTPSAFDQLPRLNELRLSSRGLLFATCSSVVAVVLSGVLPAVAATGRRSGRRLQQFGRGTTSTSLAQRALVAAQVALGLTVCVTAALLAGHYQTLTAADRGFSTDGVLTFRVGARWDEDRARVGRLQIDLLESLQRAPGVAAAGFANFLPAPGGTQRTQITVAGLPGEVPGGTYTVGSRMVGGDYFEAIGAEVMTGEACGSLQPASVGARRALLNGRFVARFAEGQRLIGRQVRLSAPGTEPYLIVGIVNDIAEDGVAVERAPYLYTCEAAGSWPDPQYVVRAADTSGLARSLGGIVRELDPGRAVFAVRDLQTVVAGTVAEPRQQAGLISAFALAALLLAACGLYALFARLVTDSRREIGVRLALGATPGGIVRYVFGQAGLLLVTGLLAGAGLSWFAFQSIRTTIHGAAATNAIALAISTGVLMAACLLAVVIPALRASRVDPTTALSSE